MGRPISGTSVTSSTGVVPPQPISVVNLGEIYFNDSIVGSREFPIAGNASLGLEAKAPLSFSLRWVPTIGSRNRLAGHDTVMATATLIF